jgi:hypothetical protein
LTESKTKIGGKPMNATKRDNERKMMVDTMGLQEILSCGRQTALSIGIAANARVSCNRRVFWNVKKVQQYLDTISE